MKQSAPCGPGGAGAPLLFRASYYSNSPWAGGYGNNFIIILLPDWGEWGPPTYGFKDCSPPLGITQAALVNSLSRIKIELDRIHLSIVIRMRLFRADLAWMTDSPYASSSPQMGNPFRSCLEISVTDNPCPRAFRLMKSHGAALTW